MGLGLGLELGLGLGLALGLNLGLGWGLGEGWKHERHHLVGDGRAEKGHVHGQRAARPRVPHHVLVALKDEPEEDVVHLVGVINR